MRTRVPRLGVRRPVRFYRVDELICAYTDDLSDRGVFVHTDAWLPVNGIIDLCVMLTDDRPTVIPARVAYCLPPDQARVLGRRSGIGFQFLAGEPGLLPLQRYVRGVGEERPSSVHASPARRVLVACRHARLEKRLMHALSPAGFELAVAPTITDLVELLTHDAWDALVLDETLQAAGRLQELKARGHGIPPLLLVAASHDELARLEAYRAGAADCLPRPFTDEELRLRVTNLVRQRARKPTPDITGTLARMPITSVLTLLEHERRSGLLLLGRGAETLSLSVHQGAICAVDGCLDGAARHRLLSALTWRDGHFEFRTGEVVGISADPWPISGLLLEAARIEDELARVPRDDTRPDPRR